MNDITPFNRWQEIYRVSEDIHFDFLTDFTSDNVIYNYKIHPEWDNFGSPTLYIKILAVDYKKHFAIMEFFGEWNDSLENDCMHLKINIVDILLECKIKYYILIVENVLTIHEGIKDYYEEWNEEIQSQKGFISILNIPEHNREIWNNLQESGGFFLFQIENWRHYTPVTLIQKVKKLCKKQSY